MEIPTDVESPRHSPWCYVRRITQVGGEAVVSVFQFGPGQAVLYPHPKDEEFQMPFFCPESGISALINQGLPPNVEACVYLSNGGTVVLYGSNSTPLASMDVTQELDCQEITNGSSTTTIIGGPNMAIVNMLALGFQREKASLIH